MESAGGVDSIGRDRIVNKRSGWLPGAGRRELFELRADGTYALARRRGVEMLQAVASGVLALAVALLALGLVVQAVAFRGPSLPECATEDSEACYWDASEMGNGNGRDFIRWGGVTFYPESGR